MVVVLSEPIKSCEFGEEMETDIQTEFAKLRAAIEDVAAVFTESEMELDRMAREAYERLRAAFGIIEDIFRDILEEIRPIILSRPRVRHQRIRPPRIREGYPWLWVAPHLDYRSTPERGINCGG